MTNSDGVMWHTSAERLWPWLPEVAGAMWLIIFMQTHRDLSSLPRWEGSSVHRPPSPTGANQRKLQARWACQSGNWKAACFDWIPNRSHLSGIRALIISPPHQSALLHQRKRVECHGEPSNFIRRVYLFIYLLHFLLLLLLLAHPIVPVVSFPKWISGSQRREL